MEAVGRDALEQVLAALPERERQVLILRFGLDSGTPRTLEEVGAVMGFSRERARQVERDALASLRSPEIRARLEDLDGPHSASIRWEPWNAVQEKSDADPRVCTSAGGV